MVPAGCLTPTANEVRNDSVVQAPDVWVQQPACATARETSSPAVKNRDEEYYCEQIEILKTINRSEFVNFPANVHHQMCNLKTELVLGPGTPL